MQNLKNIGVGFLVSFIGSIPLGYLNVIGFDIYSQKGLQHTIWYLLGVIFVEFFVIFGTLLFAKKLNSNQKLLKFINLFSIVFMFALAYIFYSISNAENTNRTVFYNVAKNFFWAGMVFSSFNFIQIPFWLSWNVYLLNKKYIEITNSKKFFYVFGTVTGTFFGMLTLILSLHYFSNQVDFLSKYLMKIIIPLVFVVMGILQAIKLFKNYKN